jgi:hypothetical protein
VYLTQGADAFAQQVKASTAIDGKIEALVDQLKAFKPKTVSDASDLVDAYSKTIDAISISSYADNLLAASATETDPTQALTKAILGAVFYELAGTQVQGTNDVFEIGKKAGGAKLAKVDVAPVAAFFRKAAEANLSAFNSLIVNPQAQQAGVSAETAQDAFSGNDFDYALALSSEGVLNGGLDKYLGSAKTANYATLVPVPFVNPVRRPPLPPQVWIDATARDYRALPRDAFARRLRHADYLVLSGPHRFGPKALAVWLDQHGKEVGPIPVKAFTPPVGYSWANVYRVDHPEVGKIPTIVTRDAIRQMESDGGFRPGGSTAIAATRGYLTRYARRHPPDGPNPYEPLRAPSR